MAAAWICSPRTRSAPARSQPMSNCATTRWCRRRRSSTSSPRRCRARCPIKTVAGAPATAGSADGLLDSILPGLQNGNIVNLTYTNSITSAQSRVSIVRVDDPSVLPLPNSATNDPNDQVIGIDFSGGMASVVTQLNAALGGANLSFSNAGTTLTVLDDGAGGLSDVNAASVTTTMSSLTGGVAPAAAVQGRRHSLHRRVSRDRRAGSGLRRPDHREHRHRQRSVEARAVRGIDRVGRYHAAGFHLFAADRRLILLFAGSRPRHRRLRRSRARC